jgi:hypothetical protein
VTEKLQLQHGARDVNREKTEALRSEYLGNAIRPYMKAVLKFRATVEEA